MGVQFPAARSTQTDYMYHKVHVLPVSLDSSDTETSESDCSSSCEDSDDSSSAGDSCDEGSSSDEDSSFDEDEDDDLNASFFMSLDEDDGHRPNTPATQPSGPRTDPLYPGAIITVFMSHLLLFQYAMRHSLTKKALDELLRLISVMLPAGSAVPKSVHALKKSLVQMFPDQKPSMQRYCSVCNRLLSHEEQCECSGEVSQFVHVPLAPQLRARLQG